MRQGKLPLPELLPILRGIAKALDAAHAKQIAHRDLKPENVFLARDEGGVFPKLLDFGIAKLMGAEPGMSAKTRSGIAVGTPYFMSPEQARGKELDHRTDLYSFGVLVYLALTGTYPFDGDDHISILMQHVTADPAAPSTRVGGLPAGVDEIVLQLMQKDPAARPENLRSAVAALERAAGVSPALDTGPVPRQNPKPGIANAVTLAPGSVPANAASPTQFVETPKRRPRAWMIVPVLAALAVLGVAAFALLGGHDKHTPAPPPPAPAPRVIVQQPAPAPPPTVIYVPVPQPAAGSGAPASAPAAAAKPRPKRPAPKKQTGKDDIIDVFGGN
jgi:serine/threonine-protein kinase